VDDSDFDCVYIGGDFRVKMLIPTGSLTNDPIESKRFIEIDENSASAAESVLIGGKEINGN